MKFTIFAGILLGGILTACSHQPVQRQVSSDSCQMNADTPPLFTVKENNSDRIVIEVGNFQDKLKLSVNEFKYSVHVSEVRELGAKDTYVPKAIKAKTFSKTGGEKTSQSVVTGDQIVVPVEHTGAYIFKFFIDEKNPFWTQKVFSIAKQNLRLSDAQKEEFAKKYAPIISFTDDEKYYPVSLEYLLNQVDPDPALAEETFRITNRTPISSAKGFLSGLFGGSSNVQDLDVQFKYKDILKVLPFYGDYNSVLKYSGENPNATRLSKRFGEKHITVYYSVFENVKRSEVIINYHFFYTFDVKNGTPDKIPSAAHMLDRESMSVVLRPKGSDWQPMYVYYGAHLASQKMAVLHPETKKPLRKPESGTMYDWLNGRVYLLWKDADKIGDRVTGAAAYGSHGMYPMNGLYAVTINQTSILTEPAGGKKNLIYPDFTKTPPSAESKPYQLKDLGLNSVVSRCNDARGILAYSGWVVDVLGPVNAAFPPFTDREENFMEYADPNAYLFEIHEIKSQMKK